MTRAYLLVMSLAALVVRTPTLVAVEPAPPAASSEAREVALTTLAGLAAFAVANGIPDAAGGQVFAGKIALSYQMGGKTQVRTQEGLHLKLADGRWMVNFGLPGDLKDVTVDSTALTAVDIASLLQAAAPFARDWNPEQVEPYLLRIAATDRARVRAALAAVPLQFATQAGYLMVVHLLRLGAPCAEDVAVLTAVGQALNGFEVDYPKPSPLHLSPIDYSYARGTGPERNDISVPVVTAALRQALHHHFRSRGIDQYDAMQNAYTATGHVISADDSRVTLAERLAALDRAAQLLPTEAVAARDDLALLRGRAALSTKAPSDAPLAERLAVWDGALAPPAEAQDAPPQGETTDSDRNEPTSLVASESDIDALIALLDDPRPCRWLDLGRARPLGDNALRALREIIGCDPRVFAGREVDAPWTNEERTATVAAVRAWRAATKQLPIEQLLTTQVPAMAPADLVLLLQRWTVEQRAPLLTALATAWNGGPPPGLSEQHLAMIMDASGDHAELATAVAGWKIEGELAFLLSALHLTRGDRAPFSAQIAARLAAEAKPGANLAETVATLRFAPTPEDLHRLAEILRRPLDQPVTAAVVGVAMAGHQWGGAASNLLQTWHQRHAKGDPQDAQRRTQVLPLALYALLLADDRPASDTLRQNALRMRQHQRDQDGAAALALPADLRVADVAGAQFPSFIWQVQQLLGDDLRQRGQQLAVDPHKPIAERDHQLAALRRALAACLAPALEAAGLPDLAPIGAPTGGDDQSLF